LRTRCKKVTDGKVEGFYQLLAGEEAMKQVKALTNEDQNYIYPVVPVCFIKFSFLGCPTTNDVSFRMEALTLNGHFFTLASFPRSRNSFLLEAVAHWLRNMKPNFRQVSVMVPERMS